MYVYDHSYFARIPYFSRCNRSISLKSEPEFYGDLVYELKKIVGPYNCSAQFIKIVSHYKKD